MVDKKKGIMDIICARCRRKIEERRELALKDYVAGLSVRRISQVRGVSRETIHKVIREARTRGELPARHGRQLRETTA